jgi:hypothetical protein
MGKNGVKGKILDAQCRRLLEGVTFKTKPANRNIHPWNELLFLPPTDQASWQVENISKNLISVKTKRRSAGWVCREPQTPFWPPAAKVR